MDIAKYLEQMDEHIDRVMQKTPPYQMYGVHGIFETDDEDSFASQMEIFEDHVLHQKGVFISELSGISQEELPDSSLMTEDQTLRLLDGLVEMMEHFNSFLDFPEGLPERMEYDILRKDWNEFKAPLVDATLHHEFCEMDEEHCPYPEYCHYCERLRTDNESMECGEVVAELYKKACNGDVIGPRDIVRHEKALEMGDFIDGVFNYCDRWCMRCEFKGRCSVNAVTSAFIVDEQEFSYSDAWKEGLEPGFGEVVESFRKKMDDLEINAREMSEGEGFQVVERENLAMNIDDRGLLRVGEYYSRLVLEWMRDTGYDTIEEMIGDSCVFNVIMMQSSFIPVKMYRSLLISDDMEDEDPIQNDRNGSAKVLMYVVEESLQAWIWVHMFRPELKDIAMQRAMLLMDLRSELKAKFPHAEKFIRPGFD